MDVETLINANKSWLMFLSAALDEAGVKYVFETSELRDSEGAAYIDNEATAVIAPLFTYGIENEVSNSIEATFRIAVITRQEPEEKLKAFYSSLAAQQKIMAALFDPSRRLVGGGASRQAFAVPLYSFDESGNPSATPLNQRGIVYRRGTWTDRTPDGSTVHLWTIEFQTTIN